MVVWSKRLGQLWWTVAVNMIINNKCSFNSNNLIIDIVNVVKPIAQDKISINDNVKEWLKIIFVEDFKINLKNDTGAEVNILSLNILLKKVNNNIKIYPTSSLLEAYGASLN